MTERWPRAAKPGAEDDGADNASSLSSLAQPPDTSCWLCRREPVERRDEVCRECRRDVAAQIRRRREATKRLPPLPDGRRDPLGPMTDAPEAVSDHE